MTRVQLQRDPFARATLMREPAEHGACVWCGSTGRRWYYAWVDDSVGSDQFARRTRRRDAACSVGCWRSYSF